MNFEELTLEKLFELLPEEISRETKNGYENNRPTLYKKNDKFGNKYRVSCYYWGYPDNKRIACRGIDLFAKGKTVKEALINFLKELVRITEFNEHLIYRRLK